jgi:hypothetical protein
MSITHEVSDCHPHHERLGKQMEISWQPQGKEEKRVEK